MSEESHSTRTEKMDNDVYEAELLRLQLELVKMQEWIKGEGKRLVVIFEGRDAAGKGGVIKRMTAYLNPRVARTVALPAPSARDLTRWYFQRYVQHLPAAGEITIFDRSWYNRAGVERVMGFCTPEQHRRFLHQAPIFERLLVEDGILVRKYWFSVSDTEQERRFKSRLKDPMRRWKLSPMDLESISRWEEYSRAKDEMMVHTDIPEAPWYVVESDNKKRARLNTIAHLLSVVPYEAVEQPNLKLPKRPASTGYRRTPRELQNVVPDYSAGVEDAPLAPVVVKKKKKKKAKAAKHLQALAAAESAAAKANGDKGKDSSAKDAAAKDSTAKSKSKESSASSAADAPAEPGLPAAAPPAEPTPVTTAARPASKAPTKTTATRSTSTARTAPPKPAASKAPASDQGNETSGTPA